MIKGTLGMSDVIHTPLDIILLNDNTVTCMLMAALDIP